MYAVDHCVAFVDVALVVLLLGASDLDSLADHDEEGEGPHAYQDAASKPKDLIGGERCKEAFD